MFFSDKGATVYALNVRFYYPYQQYTNLFLLNFDLYLNTAYAAHYVYFTTGQRTLFTCCCCLTLVSLSPLEYLYNQERYGNS